MRKTIYVITWNYGDESGHGVVRAFETEEDAVDMLNLFRSMNPSGRDFEVITTQLVPAPEVFEKKGE